MQFVLSLLFISTFASASKFHIVIDPGHGGSDNGAVYGGIREADIAKSISLKLLEFLNQDSEFSYELTRHGDVDLTLEERAIQTNQSHNADLFISIHANSSKDRRAKGAEFYFKNLMSPDEEVIFLTKMENQGAPKKDILPPQFQHSSKVVQTILEDFHRKQKTRLSSELAKSFYSSWSGQKKRKSTAIKQAPFFVISNVKVPSVLVEVGYLSHSKERRLLKDSNYQKEIAKSIYKGLVSYKTQIQKDKNAN
ncbi:MAG: N-acetylmuramoyl-L-alanine amidase [Bdellovibrionales bacterium]|nr:N-acetylmuramoyl-L-alanine amidase [Bdellovibrionales bacterium]